MRLQPFITAVLNTVTVLQEHTSYSKSSFYSFPLLCLLEQISRTYDPFNFPASAGKSILLRLREDLQCIQEIKPICWYRTW